MQPKWIVHVVVTFACVGVPVVGSAQVPDTQAVQEEIDRLRIELENVRQQYESRLSALEARLAAQDAAAPSAIPPPTGLPPMAGATTASSKIFNPDISLVGNFAGVIGENEVSEQPSLSLSEVEAAFQAVVDPYARGDFFLSVGPEGVEVEEGYITFTALPAGLLLKVGQMRAQFGKANVMHTHVLPWVDRPLVSQNLLGGDEGLADAGISVSKLIPNGFMFLDATGEIYRGDSEVFQGDERSDLNYVGRLRAFRDLTEGTNLDLGVSYAYGPGPALPDLAKQITGMDLTFRYRPLRRAIYRQFVGRTEFMWSRQDAADGSPLEAFGFYGSADYQFARRWSVGVRGDRSGRVLEPESVDFGGSLGLTFRPSEFSLIRGQYRRTRYAEAVTANEFLFQFNFAIGVHGAHPF